SPPTTLPTPWTSPPTGLDGGTVVVGDGDGGDGFRMGGSSCWPVGGAVVGGVDPPPPPVPPPPPPLPVAPGEVSCEGVADEGAGPSGDGGVPPGGDAASVVPTERWPRASSTCDSNGPRVTCWSRATSPQRAPWSWKPNTERHRSPKVPLWPWTAMAA